MRWMAGEKGGGWVAEAGGRGLRGRSIEDGRDEQRGG